MAIPENAHGEQENTKYYTIRKIDGTGANNTRERQKQWDEWITTCFQSQPGKLIHGITHIAETGWGAMRKHPDRTNLEHKIPSQLQKIRANSPLQKLHQQNPEVEQWITQPYTAQEIQSKIQQLRNNKATGADGIPGEIYETLLRRIKNFILRIMNKIQMWGRNTYTVGRRRDYTHTQERKKAPKNTETTDPYA